jgi:hypothetical protein
MFAMIDVLWFVAGGAAVWFGREPITKWWKGAETFAQSLKAKAEAILKAVK